MKITRLQMMTLKRIDALIREVKETGLAETGFEANRRKMVEAQDLIKAILESFSEDEEE